ncbi:Stf0 family sulfotransferase [Paracoccus sp. S-4012]|uniref:Stf0 family sulfotransferase n=1 Tax=Paracoccus sp. S-4012 TaxID=2665648 RepID=UPI001E5A25E0|nr:Stf0 family sulfotransferase [Paracoccus sp. S-4012]
MLSEEGEHERRIRVIFDDGFEWTAAEPRFKKPLVILAFTNRSGSNLLADYLRQSGRFRGFGEGLNADEIERNLAANPDTTFPDYIARVAGAPEEPGYWGIKASWAQIALLKRANILSMFSRVLMVHTVRRDLLGQAVSHWIAHQTNEWTSAHKRTGIEPRFDIGGIEGILMDIVRSNAAIDMISQVLGIQRHVVVYEQLQDDPAREVRRLAAELDVDLGDWMPHAPRIARQRNETNERFSALCRQRWRAALSGARGA